MENQESVVRKVSLFVRDRFDGDWKRAFDFYAQDGKISETRLKDVLKDSNVGFAVSRNFIAGMVMKVMDGNGDRYITYEEFEAIRKPD